MGQHFFNLTKDCCALTFKITLDVGILRSTSYLPVPFFAERAGTAVFG